MQLSFIGKMDALRSHIQGFYSNIAKGENAPKYRLSFKLAQLVTGTLYLKMGSDQETITEEIVVDY